VSFQQVNVFFVTVGEVYHNVCCLIRLAVFLVKVSIVVSLGAVPSERTSDDVPFFRAETTVDATLYVSNVLDGTLIYAVGKEN